MKTIVPLFFGLFLFASALGQDHGVRFRTDLTWKQALDIAKRENKFVFVDCYASWCGPCKMMDQRIYTSEKVGDFFNAKFICFKLQMDTSRKDAPDVKDRYVDAHMIRDRYVVQAFPTFLFFSPDGRAVHRGLGYQDTTDLIKLGEAALSPDQQYYTLLLQYENGALLPSKEFMNLAWMAQNFGADSLAHRIGNAYIDRLSHRELMQPGNLEFLYYFTTSSKDRGFMLFIDSADVISRIYPRMSVDVCHGVAMRVMYAEDIRPYETENEGKPDWVKIEANLRQYGDFGQECFHRYQPKLVFKSVIQPAMVNNPDWSTTLQLIKDQRLGELEKYLVGPAIVFYEGQLRADPGADCENFFAACQYYCEHFPDVVKAPQRNEFAYTLFLHDDKRVDLETALSWSRFAVDSVDANDPRRSIYMDTNSNLLYKLGRKDDAIMSEERAIAADPTNTEMVETLKKMKASRPTW